jgi:hypothetical protein
MYAARTLLQHGFDARNVSGGMLSKAYSSFLLQEERTAQCSLHWFDSAASTPKEQRTEENRVGGEDHEGDEMPDIQHHSRVDGPSGLAGSMVGFGGATPPSALSWLRGEGFSRLIRILTVASAASCATVSAPQDGTHNLVSRETTTHLEEKSYSPCAGRTFPTRPLWGDTHLHAAASLDAFANGNSEFSGAGVETAEGGVTHAQEGDADDSWRFSAALYLWGAGIDITTRLRDEVDVGFDDIVDNLDMGFMGAFEARRAKWSFGADAIYLSLSKDKAGSIGGVIPANADVDFEGWVLNLQVARNVVDTERGTVDVLVGPRYLDLESELTLRLGAMGPAPRREASGSVWDGVVGVRGNLNLNERWYLPYHIDVGTGESDFTWQGLVGVGYRFKWANIVLAYRHLAWEFDSGAQLDDISFSGPVLGVVFHF